MRHRSIGLVLLAACGTDRGTAGTADASGSADDTSVTATTSVTAASASGSAGSETSNSGGSSAADEGSSTGDTKFDLPPAADLGGGCQGGGGDVELSYIWIANSDQGTISKIDTQTMIEEGRYIVRPDSVGSPSRTSVNLAADVAVANRNGGVTKVFARVEDCVESNGMPGIQTSSGAADILPWGVEECIAWHTPMAYTTQRPVAWTQGELDPASCTYVEPDLWTASAQAAISGSVVVSRLDGATGTVEDEVPVPELLVGYFGPYGGAVNAEGDFWFIDSGNDRIDAPLVHVDSETLAYEIWTSPPISPYGIAVDTEGRPWIAGFTGGVARFDPASETFMVNADTNGLGMMPDAEGRMWVAMHPTNGEGVFALDFDTMEQVAVIPLPTQLAWGVSIDFYGYVWVVDRGASVAYRVDPDTSSYDTYAGLTGAYTYSDMTGWGLALVTNPRG